jgi:hypothetical protein
LFAKQGVNSTTLNDIMNTTSGSKLRNLGHEIKELDVTKWDADSSNVMKQLLKESFEQNPQATQRLLDTGNATLTHNQDKSKWKTEFPRLLMEVRDELRKSQSTTQPQTSTPTSTDSSEKSVTEQLVQHLEDSGNIHLNKNKISPEHPIHEYTHIWDRVVALKNPSLWIRGVELMK